MIKKTPRKELPLERKHTKWICGKLKVNQGSAFPSETSPSSDRPQQSPFENSWSFSKSVRNRETCQKRRFRCCCASWQCVGLTRTEKTRYLQIYATCCKFARLRTEPVHPTICFGWRRRTTIVQVLSQRNQGGPHWEIRGCTRANSHSLASQAPSLLAINLIVIFSHSSPIHSSEFFANEHKDLSSDKNTFFAL